MSGILRHLVFLSGLIELVLGVWFVAAGREHPLLRWLLAGGGGGEPTPAATFVAYFLALACLLAVGLHGVIWRWLRAERDEAYTLINLYGGFAVLSGIALFMALNAGAQQSLAAPFPAWALLLVDSLRGALLLALGNLERWSPSTLRELRLPESAARRARVERPARRGGQPRRARHDTRSGARPTRDPARRTARPERRRAAPGAAPGAAPENVPARATAEASEGETRARRRRPRRRSRAPRAGREDGVRSADPAAAPATPVMKTTEEARPADRPAAGARSARTAGSGEERRPRSRGARAGRSDGERVRRSDGERAGRSDGERVGRSDGERPRRSDRERSRRPDEGRSPRLGSERPRRSGGGRPRRDSAHRADAEPSGRAPHRATGAERESGGATTPYGERVGRVQGPGEEQRQRQGGVVELVPELDFSTARRPKRGRYSITGALFRPRLRRVHRPLGGASEQAWSWPAKGEGRAQAGAGEEKAEKIGATNRRSEGNGAEEER